jgi:ABC-type sugar transport system permease subunit
MQPTKLETLPQYAGKGKDKPPRAPLSMRDLGLRLIGLAFIDALAVWFAIALNNNGSGLAAIILLLVTAFVNWVFISDKLYPVRWMTPGLLLLLLMVIYPIAFNIYISFTNYGTGHILSREQAVNQLKSETYPAPNSATYAWTAYRNAGGKFRVVLVNKGQGQSYIGDESGLKPYTPPNPLPNALDDYQKLTPFQAAAVGQQLQALNLKSANSSIQLTSSTEAKELVSKYSYDASSGKLTDLETGTVYTPKKGVFTSPDGKELNPGFSDLVGADNYAKIFSDDNITRPFVGVFLWTFLFAFLTVLINFSFGLGMALILNDKNLPFLTFWRLLLIVPYAVPGFITALVWSGLFSITGPIGLFSKSIFGPDFSWVSDPNWAKVMIFFVNAWLGYPYMMLISLGALQSIPTDMYEAATIDGASVLQKFRNLTLPLLLVSVAPLLLGAFAFNFNNFTLIELLTKGGPADPTTTTPAGKTDILISYTFRLAFASGKGSDLGLAATISLFIFLIIASITAFSFRFTKQLEEVNN